MIILALAAALTQTALQPHSAQCLIEVAALSGERLDIRDPVMRDAAGRKADRLMQLHQNFIVATAEMDQAQRAYAATLPDLKGDSPAGFAEAAYQQYLADRRDSEATTHAMVSRAPSCAWPDIPPPVDR